MCIGSDVFILFKEREIDGSSVNSEYLQTLLGKCILLGVFPSAWKSAKLIVLKSPDEVRIIPRIILPVFGKLPKRTIVHRFQQRLARAESEWKFCFKPKRSIEDAFNGRVSAVTLSLPVGTFVFFCWYPHWLSVLVKSSHRTYRE